MHKHIAITLKQEILWVIVCLKMWIFILNYFKNLYKFLFAGIRFRLPFKVAKIYSYSIIYKFILEFHISNMQHKIIRLRTQHENLSNIKTIHRRWTKNKKYCNKSTSQLNAFTLRVEDNQLNFNSIIQYNKNI